MPDRLKIPWSWGTLGSLLLAGILLGGCGGYGEISPKGYDYATALYSICNRRDESRLDEFIAMLSQDRQAGEISEEEADWFAGIAAEARGGNWDEASASAREILLAQIEESR